MSDQPPRTVLERLPASGPRGSWPADEYAAQQQANGQPAPGSFAPDALGGLDGSWHAVAMEPQQGGTVRLSVRARPDIDGPGIHLQ